MNNSNPISIPFSKGKNFLWFFGAILFVAISFWLLFGNPTFNTALLDNSWFTKTLGVVAFIFFGGSIYFIIRNLMAKGPGLIIDDRRNKGRAGMLISTYIIQVKN